MRWRCRQPCDGGATGTAVAGMALSLCMRHFMSMLCNFVSDVVPARSTVRDLIWCSARHIGMTGSPGSAADARLIISHIRKSLHSTTGQNLSKR